MKIPLSWWTNAKIWVPWWSVEWPTGQNKWPWLSTTWKVWVAPRSLGLQVFLFSPVVRNEPHVTLRLVQGYRVVKGWTGQKIGYLSACYNCLRTRAASLQEGILMKWGEMLLDEHQRKSTKENGMRFMTNSWCLTKQQIEIINEWMSMCLWVCFRNTRAHC